MKYLFLSTDYDGKVKGDPITCLAFYVCQYSASDALIRKIMKSFSVKTILLAEFFLPNSAMIKVS